MAMQLQSMQMAMQRRIKQTGFTLVEMVVALSVIGVVASITPIMVMQNQASHELTKFIDQFKADSLFAKNYAQYYNTQVYIRIFPSTNEYRIYERSDQPLIIQSIPETVCIPNQTSLFVHYTGQGTISQGHTVYFGLPNACTRQAETTQSLIMTIGNAVYYHVK
ncbi:MAG: prepilin-type N-terminal cleavage/methylation domain-containing protein [Culicoidibacterales bacterium]